MRKTKIVCTMGPASENPEILKEMIAAGMNVARFNFSHGDHEEHKSRMDRVKQISGELGANVALMLDTRGPEIRLGKFKDGPVELKKGQVFILTTRDIEGDSSIASINYKELLRDVKKGSKILIDDGLVALEVVRVDGEDIICNVQNSGTISDHKGVNVPGTKLNIPAITEKDIDDIIFGIQQGIDFVAASFIRKAADVLEIRRILEENDGEDIQIISKIESQEAVENIDDIIKVSDGIMVARGDLGVEIPVEEVPLVQKQIIKKCNKAGKPVITATQMLDSMMRNPRPTRAEVTDVANAILDGTDAIMLSGETAAGKYPVESVKTMARIAEKTESSIDYINILRTVDIGSTVNITNAISHATCTIAEDLNANAIITVTRSGYTARMVSRYRPSSDIVAITPDERVLKKLSILWGVNPVLAPRMESTDEMIDKSVEVAQEKGVIKSGDVVVITAGIPVGLMGTTNLIKVHIVGNAIVKGMGIGSKPVTGTVSIIRNLEEDKQKFEKGDILVTRYTDEDFIKLMRQASAVITEEGGLTSHAAIVGLELKIPVIVGAAGATERLTDGMTITIDPVRGLIYEGKINVV
ncbi:pyruvate kinase [Calorimonas adulescens]|uniref:Pyruvate kinase n=1 Tax=Calorimonas adulescens TaxID=2606906 RepID=A0A5D8QEF0_9THEO|nr:pyruvate kinase [Calorimonas adulescens]TZE83090.1 pyruvate kinase [Calorimonas adulescens]